MLLFMCEMYYMAPCEGLREGVINVNYYIFSPDPSVLSILVDLGILLPCTDNYLYNSTGFWQSPPFLVSQFPTCPRCKPTFVL